MRLEKFLPRQSLQSYSDFSDNAINKQNNDFAISNTPSPVPSEKSNLATPESTGSPSSEQPTDNFSRDGSKTRNHVVINAASPTDDGHPSERTDDEATFFPKEPPTDNQDKQSLENFKAPTLDSQLENTRYRVAYHNYFTFLHVNCVESNK